MIRRKQILIHLTICLIVVSLLGASCDRVERPWYQETYVHDLEDNMARNIVKPEKDKPMSETNEWLMQSTQTAAQVEDRIIYLERTLDACQSR